MSTENKDTLITLRVDSALKKSLEALAEKDRRSLSDFIRLALEKLVETTKK